MLCSEKTCGNRNFATLFSLVLLLYMICSRLPGAYWETGNFQYAAVLFSNGLLFVFFLLKSKIDHAFQLAIFTSFMLILMFSSALATLLMQGIEIKLVLFWSALVLSNIFWAYMLNEEDLSWKVASIYLVFLAIFSFFLILQGMVLADIFGRTLKNSFSVFLVDAAALVYILNSKTNTRGQFPVWPALLAFLLSVWVYGRSGIISTAILLFGVLFCNFRNSKKKFRHGMGTVFFVGLVLFLFAIWQTDFVLLSIQRFSQEELASTGRVEIIKYYIQKLSEQPIRIFFGYNARFDPYLSNVWNSNLHNSFLKLHSIIGIGALVFVCFLFRGIYVKGRKDPLMWFIGFAIILRATTDTTFLFGPTDFLFFYFLFRDRDFSQRTDRPVIL